MRAAAFALTPWAGVPVNILRDTLGDRSAPVRRLGAIAVGNAGDGKAMNAFVAELACNPSAAVVELLASIGDEDASHSMHIASPDGVSPSSSSAVAVSAAESDTA